MKTISNVTQEIDTPTCKGYNNQCAGESSSGRTADSGSAREGSNPSSPAFGWRIRLGV